MGAENRKSFMIYYNWQHLFNSLSDEKAGQLLKALFVYVIDGVVPSYEDDALQGIFDYMSNQLAIDREKYEAICEKNAASAAKRWHGDKDEPPPEHSPDTSAPIQKHSTECDRIQSNTNYADIDKDIEMIREDIGIEMDKGMGIDNGTAPERYQYYRDLLNKWSNNDLKTIASIKTYFEDNNMDLEDRITDLEDRLRRRDV